MISRILEKEIAAKIYKEKAIILLGARQVGKTRLLQEMFEKQHEVLWLNADEPDIQALFENANSSKLKKYFGNNRIIILDEAQQIHEIGRKLKLVTDSLKEYQLIATGSSSFEIKNKTNEPLTGRKWEFQLFPLCFQEMVTHHGLIEEKRLIPHRLVYGYYPEIVIKEGEEKERLQLLADSFLYKDILIHQGLKKPEKLLQLLKLLASRIGSETNYNEISKELQLNNETVEKYIQLLEQCYVIFRLPSYSTHQTKEIKRGRKIYFSDNGLLNSLTRNYSILENRHDKGALWENFVISEMIKKYTYLKENVKFYFWRTHDQQEIDLIIEINEMLHCYEIKWNKNTKVRLSKTFSSYYPKHSFHLINNENIEEFLLI